MKPKPRYPETIVYTSEAIWDGKTGGTATVSDGRTIAFDTPKTFGGSGEGVCPDEMFVSSVIGCLMNTLLDFQRKMLLEVRSLQLKGSAVAKFDNEGYRIVGIRVEGKLVVDADDNDDALRAIEIMKKYCHLTRSIKDCIPIEYEIEIESG
ncbi:MAG: OsmC family protein [Candidatus Thorarchaeota archaeon]